MTEHHLLNRITYISIKNRYYNFIKNAYSDIFSGEEKTSLYDMEVVFEGEKMYYNLCGVYAWIPQFQDTDCIKRIQDSAAEIRAICGEAVGSIVLEYTGKSVIKRVKVTGYLGFANELRFKKIYFFGNHRVKGPLRINKIPNIKYQFVTKEKCIDILQYNIEKNIQFSSAESFVIHYLCNKIPEVKILRFPQPINFDLPMYNFLLPGEPKTIREFLDERSITLCHKSE